METVLILDDESTLLKLLGSVLSRQYNVIQAATAEQALDSFIQHSRHVDLYGYRSVAGKKLGDTGGPAFSRDSADLDRLGLTSVVILQKPFPPKMLLKAIRELMAGTRTERARTA